MSLHCFLFQGLTALVTGGASGLGKATAERFVKHGARVVICDLPSSDGEKVAEDLGENCAFAPTDVSVHHHRDKSFVALFCALHELAPSQARLVQSPQCWSA